MYFMVMLNEKIGDANKILLLKANTFFKEKSKVHISYKGSTNKSWKNGLITDIAEDYITLDESHEGIITIFFEEIRNIEKFTSIDERGEK